MGEGGVRVGIGEETRVSLKLAPFKGTEVRRGIVVGVWVDNPLHFRRFVISPVGD